MKHGILFFLNMGNITLGARIAILPLIYLTPMCSPDKTMGVYLAEPIADFLAVSFTILLFKKQFKKAIASMDESVNPA